MLATLKYLLQVRIILQPMRLVQTWFTDLVQTEGQGWVVWPVDGVDCSPACTCWCHHFVAETWRATSSSQRSRFCNCWRCPQAWATNSNITLDINIEKPWNHKAVLISKSILTSRRLRLCKSFLFSIKSMVIFSMKLIKYPRIY